MKNCKNCANRCIYTCDIFGDIPAGEIEKSTECNRFEQLASGEETLRDWLAGVESGTIEHGYIQDLLNAMQLKPPKNFDSALHWLYSIKDSKAVRAVRADCFVFNLTEYPF